MWAVGIWGDQVLQDCRRAAPAASFMVASARAANTAINPGLQILGVVAHNVYTSWKPSCSSGKACKPKAESLSGTVHCRSWHQEPVCSRPVYHSGKLLHGTLQSHVNIGNAVLDCQASASRKELLSSPSGICTIC